MARARREGKLLGRPASLTEAQKHLIAIRLDAGATVSALAREFGTSRQTIMRARSGLAS